MFCGTYSNGRVVSAQCLSIAAFFLSFGWIWAFVVGFCAMFFQLVLFCCVVHRGVFWGFVVTSLIAAGINFYTGYAIMSTTLGGGFCYPILTIEMLCDDMRTSVGTCNYVSGSLWTIIAILDLAFLLSNEEDGDDKIDEQVAAAAVPASEENVSNV